MRRIISLVAPLVGVLIALPFVPLGPVGSWVASAHPGAHPPSPPTHDYNTATVGTQPPTAAVLANPTGRLLASLRLSTMTIVPLEELQAILPAGFTANPLPPPNAPGLAGMGLLFDFQGQCDHFAAGTSSPASGLYALHIARNTALGRNELLNLAAEFSDDSFINCHRALLGPGGSRRADVELEVQEKGGQLQLKFEVEDEAIGLRVDVRAEGPATIIGRGHADPAGSPLRTLENGMFANPAHRFSIMSDSLVVPTTTTNFTLKAGNDGDGGLGRLRLPGGTVKIVGLGPTFTLQRSFENFLQPE